MRKAITALAAVPVIASLYIPVLARGSVAARVALVFGAGAIVLAGAVALALPKGTVAVPTPETKPVPAAAFRPIAVSHDLVSPIIIDFSVPMDPVSVEAALTIEPASPIITKWSADAKSLAVTPISAWQPSTFHTITIAGTAHDATGTAVGTPIRSVFLSDAGAIGRLDALAMTGDKALTGTSLKVAFDKPVDRATVAAAFRSTPSVEGTWVSAPVYLGSFLVFQPSEPLAPSTAYTFSFDETLKATDGTPFGMSPTLTIQTDQPAAVVRFRPRSGWSDVPRGQDISVRFDQPMDRASTRAAFSVSIGGAAIAGSYRWAEKDTVLVFNPSKALPYGAKVSMEVAATAMSAAGSPIATPVTGTFTVEKKPVVKKVAATKAPARTQAIAKPSGGGSTGSATWYAVEKYYFKLLTCTRGGGLVTSSGACSSPGGSGLAALKLDAGISTKVSRPYAKKLAVAAACDHFLGGTSPGTRLKAAGYKGYTWGENIGCRSGNPSAAVLASHLVFQGERSSNGGHWKNMMNSRYDRVGIGVWVSSGRVRLVCDFYHP